MTNPRPVLLRAEDPDDREDWLAAWEECGSEPFAHPAYAELFATSPRDRARCLLARSDYDSAILPFVLRAIPHSTNGLRPALQDGISPYGYGGPYGTSADIRAAVWPLLTDWMRQEGVVSMFVRLALDAVDPAILPPHAVVKTTADNIVVNLTRPEPEQWLHYEHKVRKNVKRALQAGLSVSLQPQFTDLREFVSLYSHTMARREASAFYRFGYAFFETIQRELPGNYLAAEIRDIAGKLVSAELVLTSDQFMYSYLGGTREGAFSARPNDLLKHAVINYGRATGRRGYVLGGGYAANDGIFRYKRSFDPTGCVPFRTMRLIGNLSAYELLTVARAEASAVGRREGDEQHYFPAYRTPARDTTPTPSVTNDRGEPTGAGTAAATRT